MEETSNSEKKKKLMQYNDNKLCNLFQITELSNYFIIPFLVPIFCALSNYLLPKVTVIYIQKKIDFKYNFMIHLLIYFPQTFAIFLHLIRSLRSKTISDITENREEIDELEEERRTEARFFLIYKEKNMGRKFFLLFLILLTSLLFVISEILRLELYLEKSKSVVLETRWSFLIFGAFFSYFILEENIKIHQKVTLIMAIILVFLLVFNNIIFNVIIGKENFNIKLNIFRFLATIPEILSFVIVKKIFDKYYVSPYMFLTLHGLFNILLTLLFYCFKPMFDKTIDEGVLTYFKNNIVLFFRNMDTSVTIFLIISLISVFIYNIFLFLTLFYFNPMFFCATDLISPFLSWTYEIIAGKTSSKSVYFLIINFIVYFFIIINSFVYNELIILNFCGLNKDTKKQIHIRGDLETLSLEGEDNDDAIMRNDSENIEELEKS